MSKSKSKGSKDTTKSQSDVLTKVKDAAVVKPAQTVKAKAKDLAKAVVGKEEKKSKQKKVKEPTPEPSDSESEESESESDESESSADSDSDSESEAEVKKPTANGKANGAKKVAAAESSDESDSSESSSDEAPAKKTNGAKQPAAKADSDSESDEASDSDDSEDESEEKPKAVEAKAKKETKTKVASSDDESDADSDDSGSDDSEEDSDDSDDSDESEEETKPKQVTNKRKAEEEAVSAAKKTKTETDSAAPETGNLFVGNLSWNVDEDWLTREFETFGELSGVRIITDRESGRSKGFGYVEFVNPADAAKAHAAKAGSELDGRNINVDFAVKREQGAKPQDRANDRRKSYGDSTSDPSDTLFCGNLSFDADQDTISQAFAEYGTVLGVRLPTDRETGAPKGFGYVTFSSVEEAGAAMEAMNGAEIAGRSVRLDYSQPRPQNGDSPARGRGGFGGGRGFGDRGGRGGGRGFGDRGGRGGGRGRGFGDRGGRGGRGASTNRGGFGDFSGKKTTF